MIVLIVAGIVYAVWFDSLVVAILTGAMILYRAQRPGTLLRRIREAWYLRQTMQAGDDGDPLA